MGEIKIKKLKPLFNFVITTANRYTAEELIGDSGLVRADIQGVLKPYQTVIEVGDRVTLVKPGDFVAISLDRYARVSQKKDTMKQSMDEYYNANVEYHVPVVLINDKECLQIGDNDIKFVIEEWEEITPKPNTNNQLIVPDKSILM